MTNSAAAQTWQGRVEDDALLRGEGRFGDDVKPEGALVAQFVRSPHGFARIEQIDVAEARKVRGVVAVFTAADLAGEHYHSLSHGHPIPGRGGKPPISPHRPVLAGERVMHIGEPVAMVVAVSAAAAQDGAEKVAVDYQPLDAVTDVRAAGETDAPQLWPEAPGNIAFDWTAPPDPDGKKQAALERAFKEAAHVVRVELVNQRLVVGALEPRTATASYDAASKRFVLRCPSQSVAAMRGQMIETMNLKPEELHVLTDDVGGAFGMKGASYPEYVAMLHAARALGKPVHWVSTRAEAFVSDCQGRDSIWSAELALNTRGRFLALRVDGTGNVGAYMTAVAHFVFTLHIAGCLPTVYDIPLAQVNARCVFTNTVPTAPYRGAGRPEASYLLERLIDAAADRTGIDAAELRRRNLIQPAKLPYKTAFGNTYDSGDFPAAFERALTLADYAGFPARRKAAKKQGKLRGIGIGCYLEIAGAFPEEPARISFPGGETVEVSIGAGASGQGHQTVFGKVAARKLGIAPEAVRVTSGDSDRDVPGFGAVASRSAMYTGGAVANTADAVIAKGKHVAALLLQADEGEIVFADGKFSVKNSAREVSLFQAAARAVELHKQGVISESLDTTAGVKAPPSFPNGCHVAEVEIDSDTGALAVVNYVAIGDCGNVLDNTIVTGQVHGGVAQGLGQALSEATVYDAGGQLVSGTFMDYAMPRADTVPPMTVEHFAVACRTNPLGVKGTGEAGTTAAPPALINAVLDALPQGATLDMPATPERIWQALRGGAVAPAFTLPVRAEKAEKNTIRPWSPASLRYTSRAIRRFQLFTLFRRLSAVLGLLALAACASYVPESEPSMFRNLARPGAELDVAEALKMVSGFRQHEGLPPVTLDPALMQMAQAQAALMARRDKLEHNLGRSFAARLKASGFDAAHAAENIGAGYHTLAEAFSGWRNSPPHRDNMLLAGATRMGIAAVYTPNSKYKVFWAMEIAQPDERKSAVCRDCGPTRDTGRLVLRVQ